MIFTFHEILSCYYSCYSCTATFTQLGNLNRHKRIHVGGGYSCDVCQKRFTQVLLHPNGPFHCSHFFFSSFLFNNNPHCLFLNPTFQLPYLEKHKLTHEPNAKQKHGNATKTVCNLCHKKFSNNMALRGHMKKHKEKTANFRCPVCKKRFQAAEVMDTRLSIRMSMTSALHKLMMI